MVKFLEQLVYWWSSYATGSDVDALCALDSVVVGEDANEKADP